MSKVIQYRFIKFVTKIKKMAMRLPLTCWTSDLEVGGLSLVSAVMLFSQTRNCISNVYKMGTGDHNAAGGGVTLHWTSIPSRVGVAISPFASYY